MKNTLAMVQAIASQTLKGVTERDAVEAFTRRIAAMGLAHDQLLQQKLGDGIVSPDRLPDAGPSGRMTRFL